MTKIQMEAYYKKRIRQIRSMSRKEIEREVSDILSKWSIKIGGGFFIFGIIVGRFSKI